MPRKIETENHVKTLVKEWFDSRGAWHYAPIQTGLGAHGIHDRIGCVPITVTREMVGKTVGLFVSVECKRPGRRMEENWGMSKHQTRHYEEINRVRGIAYCVDGAEDLKGLSRVLDDIRNGSR